MVIDLGNGRKLMADHRLALGCCLISKEIRSEARSLFRGEPGFEVEFQKNHEVHGLKMEVRRRNLRTVEKERRAGCCGDSL